MYDFRLAQDPKRGGEIVPRIAEPFRSERLSSHAVPTASQVHVLRYSSVQAEDAPAGGRRARAAPAMRGSGPPCAGVTGAACRAPLPSPSAHKGFGR